MAAEARRSRLSKELNLDKRLNKPEVNKMGSKTKQFPVSITHFFKLITLLKVFSKTGLPRLFCRTLKDVRNGKKKDL